MVSVDGALSAVFVCLEQELYGAERARWNLEAGFGACDMRWREPFEALPQALEWAAARVGARARALPTRCDAMPWSMSRASLLASDGRNDMAL